MCMMPPDEVWRFTKGEVRKANFREHSSLLKNSFALVSAPGSGAENAGFVVFWACFEPLLDRRPDRQRLFQQPDSFHALGCIRGC
jgi:hypothetical protein